MTDEGDPFRGGGATVEQARARLQSRVMAGERVDCPCCGQRAALYARKVNASMARQLRRLAGHGGWMSAEEVEAGERGGGDYAKLKFWGLATGDGQGNWALTPKGRSFVDGETTVPAVVFVFDDRAMSFSRERARFADCLREQQPDLMAAE